MKTTPGHRWREAEVDQFLTLIPSPLRVNQRNARNPPRSAPHVSALRSLFFGTAAAASGRRGLLFLYLAPEIFYMTRI